MKIINNIFLMQILLGMVRIATCVIGKNYLATIWALSHTVSALTSFLLIKIIEIKDKKS